MKTRIFPGNLNLNMDLVGKTGNIYLITIYMQENREFLSAARSFESFILYYIREAKKIAAKKKQMDVVIKRGVDVIGKEREKWIAVYMCKHFSYCN